MIVVSNVKATLFGLIINGENISENYNYYRNYSRKKEE
jgi:hypothetical protein